MSSQSVSQSLSHSVTIWILEMLAHLIIIIRFITHHVKTDIQKEKDTCGPIKNHGGKRYPAATFTIVSRKGIAWEYHRDTQLFGSQHLGWGVVMWMIEHTDLWLPSHHTIQQTILHQSHCSQRSWATMSWNIDTDIFQQVWNQSTWHAIRIKENYDVTSSSTPYSACGCGIYIWLPCRQILKYIPNKNQKPTVQ